MESLSGCSAGRKRFWWAIQRQEFGSGLDQGSNGNHLYCRPAFLSPVRYGCSALRSISNANLEVLRTSPRVIETVIHAIRRIYLLGCCRHRKMNRQGVVIDFATVLTVDSRPNPIDHRWHLKGSESQKAATHSAATHCFLGQASN